MLRVDCCSYNNAEGFHRILKAVQTTRNAPRLFSLILIIGFPLKGETRGRKFVFTGRIGNIFYLYIFS
jgi:hypothetical protein